MNSINRTQMKSIPFFMMLYARFLYGYMRIWQFFMKPIHQIRIGIYNKKTNMKSFSKTYIKTSFAIKNSCNICTIRLREGFIRIIEIVTFKMFGNTRAVKTKNIISFSINCNFSSAWQHFHDFFHRQSMKIFLENINFILSPKFSKIIKINIIFHIFIIAGIIQK